MALILYPNQTIVLDSAIYGQNLNNIECAVYYAKKSDSTFEEKTIYPSITSNVTSYTIVPSPSEGYIYSIRNIFIYNGKTEFTNLILKMNNYRFLGCEINPKNSWQLYGGQPNTPRGIDHTREIPSGSWTDVNFWGDKAETISLGSVRIPHGINGTSVTTEIISQVDYDNLVIKDPNILYLIQS